MAYTLEDYYPPLEGHLDDRRLAMFADNHGWSWEYSSKRVKGGLRVTVAVDGRHFEAEHADGQTALNLATDKAVAALDA